MAAVSITPRQCRAARAALGASRAAFARHCGLSTSTLANFETGRDAPSERTLETLALGFARSGVDFVAPTPDRGFGVRTLRPKGSAITNWAQPGRGRVAFGSTASLLRAGRQLIGLSQAQMASRAQFSVQAVCHAESLPSLKKGRCQSALIAALERTGVLFLAGDEEHGPAVCLADPHSHAD